MGAAVDRKLVTMLLLVAGAMIGAVFALDPSPKEGVAEAATLPAPVPPTREPTPTMTPETWHIESDLLWARIVHRQFRSRADVASGRFLEAFDEKAHLLEQIDLAEAQDVVRTPHWLRANVPVDKGDRTDWVRVRFVLDGDGAWKIEDLRETRAPLR